MGAVSDAETSCRGLAIEEALHPKGPCLTVFERDVYVIPIRCGAGTSNDTELEKLEKRLQFVMYCIDCFVS
jgi:hypothetical protein